MPKKALPLLPRLGFALLILVLSLALAIFVLLFVVVEDERWSFLLPMGGMVGALGWAAGMRRSWIDRRTASDEA